VSVRQLGFDFQRPPPGAAPSAAGAGAPRASTAGTQQSEGEGADVSSERLAVELERLALRHIREAYATFNGNLFGFKLKTPTFALTSTQTYYGRWVPSSRTLELDRRLLTAYSWGVLVEVLKHEMAHQFVDEVLKNPDGRPHGEVFREVCAERGIDAAAQGLPEGSRTADADSRVLERIAKLLALAESPNLNEAQAAMTAARRLMLKYNVERASAPGAGRYTFRHFGVPTGRRSQAERVLAIILGEYFFVEVIWVPVWRAREGKRGNVLEVCGSLENLEIAGYVYDFLTQTAERLWRDHKKREGITRVTERQCYLYGVMSGFRDKLEKETALAKKEGLVWVGDADLSRYYRARHPYTRTTHVSSSADAGAYQAGHAAGQKIVLHRGVKQGPSGGPKLLSGR
jgi:hypothetical protein